MVGVGVDRKIASYSVGALLRIALNVKLWTVIAIVVFAMAVQLLQGDAQRKSVWACPWRFYGRISASLASDLGVFANAALCGGYHARTEAGLDLKNLGGR